jgi:catalase
MVSHLLNIDAGLAKSVGDMLGLRKLPKPADAAIATREDLEPSPALSIVANGPKRFEGRKLGVLVTDGVDATLLNALKLAVTKAGGVCEIVAPNVTGVEASDGTFVAADEMIDGGPSVLFDAVAILPGDDGVASLVAESTARDFVADAFAHCKFIAHVDAAMPLFEKAGISDALDEGVVALSAKKDVAAFVALLGDLRLWSREPKVKAPAN